MEITDISVTKLGVSLDEPKRTSAERQFDFRPAAIVTVETDEGITGIGEGYGPNPHIVETIVEQKYRPRLLEENPLDRERLWGDMLILDTYWDQKGQGVAAASGVDMALWDIAGKYYDEPLYRLLGGDVSGDGLVQAYASDLFWDEPSTMATRAASYVDRGFPAVKAHLGRGVDADEKRVAAIQDAIGDADLMVDMNCGYDRADAFRVGRMLDSYDVYWYEEPLSPYDIEGHAQLRRKLDTPIATGENEYTKWGFRQLFEAEAVDYAMPDIMRCGGITETKKICAVAEAFNVTATLHSYTTGVGLAATLHLLASTPGCEWLEYDVTNFPLLESLFKNPPELDGTGQVALPTEPGLGVELPADIVDKYGLE
jgi:D-galactarolactone cycloisomerase